MQLNYCELNARLQTVLNCDLCEWLENESKSSFHKLNSARKFTKTVGDINFQRNSIFLKLFATSHESIYSLHSIDWHRAQTSRFQFSKILNDHSGIGAVWVNKQKRTPEIQNEANVNFSPKLLNNFINALIPRGLGRRGFVSLTAEKQSKTGLRVGLNRSLKGKEYARNKVMYARDKQIRTIPSWTIYFNMLY